jgi:hypothetical protein
MEPNIDQPSKIGIHRFYRKLRKSEKLSVFSIKFNFSNLEKKPMLYFRFIVRFFRLSTDFLFKIQILNKNNKLVSFSGLALGFLVYLSIFPVFIFSNFQKKIKSNRSVFDRYFNPWWVE